MNAAATSFDGEHKYIRITDIDDDAHTYIDFEPVSPSGVLDERYREENIEAFEKFFFKHIYAKEWNEIDLDILQSYSDWHKDMFGYRPRSTDKDW